MPDKISNVVIEDARIGFKNFSGRPGPYNADGSMSFAVFLDDKVAKQLEKDGWNVKVTKDREIDGEVVPGEPYLVVNVKYRGRTGQEVPSPPQIYTIGDSSGNRNTLTEATCSVLDDMEIVKTDLEIRPYSWTMFEGTPQEYSGVSAYLKKMYVIVHEDHLDLKYSAYGNED